MSKNVIMYVRDNNYTPKGVVNITKGDYEITSDNRPVIFIGWSKAHKNDVFIKKTGRTIAIRRSEKAYKWYANNDKNDNIGDISMVDGLDIPYIIKDSLESCFDTAKRVYGIAGKAIFVIPTIKHTTSLPDNPSLEDTIKHLEDTVVGKNTTKQITTYKIINY